jgi:hypothetical protein
MMRSFLLAITAIGESPEQFAAEIRADTARSGKVTRAVNVHAD